MRVKVGRRYRFAIGIVAGWAMAVLVPGAVAGLVVYQVNVTRIAPAVPTLVSGIRAEVTVVNAEVVHITPVMRATIMVASEDGGDELSYAGGNADGPAVEIISDSDGAPLHEGPAGAPSELSPPGSSIAGGSVYLPIQPTDGASTPKPTATLGLLATETMTPLPLAIDKAEPTIAIEPLPTPTFAATETIGPTPQSTPTLAATETIAPTIAPVDTWTPVPTFEATPIPTADVPTETVTSSPVPVVLPTETATTSPLESPLATPTAMPSATPVETETPTP